ncbi:MAG: HlyC/CorC family transporter [Clostridia bacterium]|nr:HlyC/CorC family transporter [Clostridia bacterium]
MLIKILILFLLIILNGIFSASEMAFVSLNKFELEDNIKKGNKKSRRIKKLLDNSSGFLATIQICITLAGFLSSAFAAETFAEDIVIAISPYLTISTSILETITIILVTLVLSYFTLVLGELLPKRIALAYPEKVSYLVVNIIYILEKILYPFVWLLTKSTSFICKIFKIKIDNEEKLTEKEIISIISTGKEDGIIDSTEKAMLLNIFKFDDTMAEKVMTIREKMIAVDTYISEKALLNVIRTCKYSRIPVYKDKLDNIVGILVVKDLIMQYSRESKFDIKKILREAYFVNFNDKVDEIFKEMQHSKHAMAIVKNGNRTVGLITLEDAIEEILGNISDEYN